MTFCKKSKYVLLLLIVSPILCLLIMNLAPRSRQDVTAFQDATEFTNRVFNSGSSSNKELSTFSPIANKETQTSTSTVIEETTSSNNYPYRYILNHPEKCKTDFRLRLVMIIISAPSNNYSRLAIRGTWGTASFRKDVAMVFLLGATTDTSLQNRIVEEDNLYGDIVQEDFTDSYRNLTLKTTALLRWANLFCKNAEFVLKVDDDNFVHVPNLLDRLEEKSNSTKTIFGHFVSKTKPIRDKNIAKWYVSEEEFAGEFYPDYIGGPAYLIKNDSVKDLLHAATVLKFLYIEDVFVTGLCAAHANISRIDDAKFLGRLDSANMNDPLVYRKLITLHSLPATSFFEIWKNVSIPLTALN